MLLDADLKNGTGHRTVTMEAPLVVLTSGSVRYEAVLHSCGTSLVVVVVVGGLVLTCDSALMTTL